MKKRKEILFNDPFPIYMAYHRKYLWNFVMNLFKWKNMPTSIDMRYFNDKLITEGWANLLWYNKDYGFMSLDGAVSGVDVYYRPNKYTSTNPVLKSVTREVSYIDHIVEDRDKAVCVCYNTLDYTFRETMVDLVEIYAYKLAQADVSINVSLENSRATLIPAVSDVETAKRVTETLRDIYAGKPATIAYRNSFGGDDFSLVPIKAKDNLITTDLSDSKRQILAEFLTRLGVNVTSVDKKERVLEAEATSNKQELKLNSKIYLEPRKLFCKEVNETFGLNIDVEIDYEMVEEFTQENGLGGVEDEG